MRTPRHTNAPFGPMAARGAVSAVTEEGHFFCYSREYNERPRRGQMVYGCPLPVSSQVCASEHHRGVSPVAPGRYPMPG